MVDRYTDILSRLSQLPLSRRTLLRRAGLMGLSLPLATGLLAACADEDDADDDDAGVGADDDADDTDDEADDEEDEDEDDESVEPDEDDDDEDDDEAAGATRDVINVGVWTEVSVMDPTRSVQTPNRFMFSQMFDPLLHQEYYPDLETEPRLAEAWEYSDDMTIRFHLREGVQFHNGEEFTAESVRFSLELYADPTSQAATKTTNIDEVVVVDDYTVDVVMTQADPILIYDFHDGFFMVPPEHYEEVGPEEFGANPVGTGPFMFEEWSRGDHLTAVANPDYYRGAPRVNTVNFRFIPEDATRVAALQSGDVDLATAVPPALANELEADPDVSLSNATDPAIIYLGFKWQVEDLRDRTPAEEFLSNNQVRHALTLATDKQAIVENLLFGYATMANQLAFPDAIGFNPDIPEHEFDPDRARELLAEAGYPDGFDGEIEYGAPIGLIQAAREVSQSIASDWADVGVNLSINMVEVATFSAEHLRSDEREGLEPVHMYRKAYPSLDAGQTHATAWCCECDWNYSRYCNEEVDELVERQGSTLDLEEREEIMDELAQVLYDDHPYVWVYFADWIVATNEGVDYQSRYDGIVHVYDIQYT